VDADRLRELPQIAALAAELGDAGVPPRLATHAARRAVSAERTAILAGEAASASSGGVAERVRARAAALAARMQGPPLPRVINATGTVLHTGLGRAPLSERARAAAERVLGGYCQLEFDLASGKRGDRQGHVAELLCALSGAEAALVVNNCAGALVLVLQALAQGRSVPVSRGELVEIGGSFRVPEIMACAGCRLIEVGASNKTHLRDYQRAIDADTALLLKVHQSNFRQRGFVSAVPSADLARLAQQHDLPLAVDQGSGALLDMGVAGYDIAPVQAELEAGADLVCCSGDKLLGGPQAGIVLGSAELVQRCARHPLARALRVDKCTLAALAGTLHDYLLADPWQTVPSLAMLRGDVAAAEARARRLCEACPDARIEALPLRGAVGSGALPEDGPESFGVALRVDALEQVHRALRQGDPAVVGRVHDGRLLLDLGTVTDDELDVLSERLRACLT